ncbi:MAG TPA: ThuA domain-containing protein [Terriglobales bacterium]
MAAAIALSVSALPAQQPAPAPVSPAARGRGRGRGFSANCGTIPGRSGLGRCAAGMVLNPTFDQNPPQLPAGFKGGILIFSKTNGFREEAAMEASDVALASLAWQHRWPYVVTENGAVMNPAQLKQFKLVIFNNTSGDILTTTQRAALRAWVEAGGTWIGIHGAGGDPVNDPWPRTDSVWPWYVNTLIGAQFTSHSPIQAGNVDVEAGNSLLTRGLPKVWNRTDEWYAFATDPRAQPGFHILATADEKSYNPGRSTMGADHPLIWWHCVDRGHALFSALGHGGWEYWEPTFLQFLDNSVVWGMQQKAGQGCS